MSVTRIPIDGLWRCLCPSFDRVSLVSTARRRTQWGEDGSSVRLNSRRAFHTSKAKRWPAHGIGENYGGGEEEGGDASSSGFVSDQRGGGKHFRRVETSTASSTNPIQTPIPRRVVIKPTSRKPTSFTPAQENWLLKLAHEAMGRRNSPGRRVTRGTVLQSNDFVFRKVLIPSEISVDGDTQEPISRQSGANDQLKRSVEHAREKWIRQKVANTEIKEEKRAEGLSETTAALAGAAQIPNRQDAKNLSSQESGGEPVRERIVDKEMPSLPFASFDALKKSNFFFSQAYAQDLRVIQPGPELSTPSTPSLNWSDRAAVEETHVEKPVEGVKMALDVAHVQVLDEDLSPQSDPRDAGSHLASVEQEPANTSEVDNESRSLSATHLKPWNDTSIFPDSQGEDEIFREIPAFEQEELSSDESTPLAGYSSVIDSAEWTTIPDRRSPPSPDQLELGKDEVQTSPEFTGSTLLKPLSVDLPVSLGGEIDESQEPDSLLHDPPPENSVWDKIPTVHLHNRLRSLTTAKNAYSEICQLVAYLLRNRGEQPSLIHYDALIRANADAEFGSANVVKHLLQDMKILSIGADSGLYHGVLQVLAIHPDYMLRDQILKEMKIRWFGLSPEGWHNYVVGLIRDRQYEVAMDKLEHMQSENIAIQPWLYDIFMFQLCDAGELDEVLTLLKFRVEHRGTIETSIWYYVLDAFTKAYHYEGTIYVWKKRIRRQQHFVPSDGMCTAMLNVAARYANTELATAAVRILSTRLPVLGVHHYEALLTAYVTSGDVKTAFRVLAIMSKAQMQPDMNTTRPIFNYLSTSIELCRAAWTDLKSLSNDGHVIPVPAANVILESTAEVGHFDEAVSLYKQLHEVIESGPDVETFNTLLQGAVYAGRKDLCMFLASEMAALEINPNELTYDRLILACVGELDYEDAFRYLEEMIAVGAGKGDGGWWMRRGTALALSKRCAVAGDERAWDIYNQMLDRGMEVKHSWIMDQWQTAQQDSLMSEDGAGG